MAECIVLRTGTALWTSGQVTIASFDPAIKNLAVRIEVRAPGAPFRALYFAKWELPADPNGTYPALCAQMEAIAVHLAQCQVAIVERQNPITSAAQVHSNSKVNRVFGFLTGWLCGTFPHLTVYDVSPKLKRKELGDPAQTKMSYAETKKWAIATALRLVDARGDQASVQTLTKRGTGKKDDLADVTVQIEAFLRCIARVEHANA